jgi:hypothetical protein
MALRKDRAFTPWLNKRITLERTKQFNATCAEMCLMVYNTSTKHVHASRSGRHAASFDIRVGGSSCRALFDTGATCSCISLTTAIELDLELKPAPKNPVTGIGGTTIAQFTTATTVKIGKSKHQQVFLVLDRSSGGYDVLLGEDYLRSVGGAIRLSHNICSLEIGHDLTTLRSRVTRSVFNSSLMALTDTPSLFMHSPCTASSVVIGEISSHSENKRLRNSILAGKQIAYKVEVAIMPDFSTSKGDHPIPNSRLCSDCH